MKAKFRRRFGNKLMKNRTDLQACDMKACASVVIPALNEAKRIQEVVAYALADPATAEVIVIDDSSIDDTAMLARQAGAQVLTSSMLGKGISMCDGAAAATQEMVVYLDGDLANLRPGIITSLCLPLLNNEADFVKARFGHGGGRVTELTAKPMVKVFFPNWRIWPSRWVGSSLYGSLFCRRLASRMATELMLAY